MNKTCVFCSTPVGSADSFPIGSFENEARSIGMCDDCYEKFMNIPKPSNKDSWGKIMGHCPCCSATVYAVNLNIDKASCSICQTDLIYIQGKFRIS